MDVHGRKSIEVVSGGFGVSPKILWVNLMVDSGLVSLLSDKFSRIFEVCTYRGCVDQSVIDFERPKFIFFEYDYPDCDSLKYLKNVKRDNSEVPIVMVTLQHSEELAIWALRNRVWDYYYKPIGELCFSDLAREIVGYCSHEVASDVDRNYSNNVVSSSYPNEVRFKSDDTNQVLIDTALNYLDLNYSKKITEQAMASLCNLSRFQFSRNFKKIVGMTFQNYLLDIRIKKAKKLLNNPNAKVTDIAYTVGFTDPSYFTRMFKKASGLSPTDYRPKEISKLQ